MTKDEMQYEIYKLNTIINGLKNENAELRRKNNILDGKVTTITYGQKEKWGNRNEAIASFIECIENSEGAERNRYVNVLLDLLRGENVCDDRGGIY